MCIRDSSWTGDNFSTTTQDVTVPGEGAYQVVVTDNFGCSKTKTFNICATIDKPLMAHMNSFATEPCTNGEGAINGLIITSGNEPYSFQWAGPSGPLPFNGKTVPPVLTEPGTYTVTVTDACSQQQVLSLIHISEPTRPY